MSINNKQLKFNNFEKSLNDAKRQKKTQNFQARSKKVAG